MAGPLHPLMLRPFRMTGWVTDEDLHPAARRATWEDYPWAGQPVQAGRLDEIPLFWTLEAAAASFGETAEEYIATGRHAADPGFGRVGSPHKPRPRAVIWSDNRTFFTDMATYLRPHVEEMAAELEEAGIFAGEIDVAVDSGRFTAFSAGVAWDALAACDDTPFDPDGEDDTIYAKTLQDYLPRGGEVLYLAALTGQSVFTYSYTDPDTGDPVERSLLKAANTAFIRANVPLHDRVAWFGVVGESGDPPGDAFVRARCEEVASAIGPEAELYFPGGLLPDTIDDVRAAVQAKIRDFFGL